MKLVARVLPLRPVGLKQSKLSHDTMGLMKFNSPQTYQWAPHRPKMVFFQALRVQLELKVLSKIFPATVWLPDNLQHNTTTSTWTFHTHHANQKKNVNVYLLGG